MGASSLAAPVPVGSSGLATSLRRADSRLARAWNVNPLDVRARRKELGVKAQ